MGWASMHACVGHVASTWHWDLLKLLIESCTMLMSQLERLETTSLHITDMQGSMSHGQGRLISLQLHLMFA